MLLIKTSSSSFILQLAIAMVLILLSTSMVAVTGTASKVVAVVNSRPLSAIQLAKEITTTTAIAIGASSTQEEEEEGAMKASLFEHYINTMGQFEDPCQAFFYIPTCLSATSTDNTTGTPVTSSLNCTWCCGATSQCISGNSTCRQPSSSSTPVSWRIDVNTNTSTSSTFNDFLKSGGTSKAGASMYTTCQNICSEIGIRNNQSSSFAMKDDTSSSSSSYTLKSVAPTLLNMCEPCTSAPFCYFCGSRGGSCIGGNGYCKDGVIVQDCQYLDGGSKGVVIVKGSDNFFLNMSLQSTTMMMMLMMSIMCGLGLLLYMIPRIVRRRRERQRLEALEVAWRRDFRNGNGGEGGGEGGGDTTANNTPALTPTGAAANRDSPSSSRRRGGGGRGRAGGSGGRGGGAAPTTNPPPTSSSYPPPPPVPATDDATTATRQAADTTTTPTTTAAADGDTTTTATGYIATTISPPTPSSSGAAMLLDDVDDDNTCLLCYEQPRSVAFIPCYHAYYCRGCSNRIRPTAGAFICPSCRQPVEAMVDYTRALK